MKVKQVSVRCDSDATDVENAEVYISMGVLYVRSSKVYLRYIDPVVKTIGGDDDDNCIWFQATLPIEHNTFKKVDVYIYP